MSITYPPIPVNIVNDVSGGVPHRAGLLKIDATYNPMSIPEFLSTQQVRFVPRHLNDGVTGDIY